MSEIRVALSRLLMMRSTAIVPTLMTSCFSVVKEVNQAMIGWIVAAFLALVAHG